MLARIAAIAVGHEYDADRTGMEEVLGVGAERQRESAHDQHDRAPHPGPGLSISMSAAAEFPRKPE